MQNLKISAIMANDIAVCDDWSPDFPSLIEYLLLARAGLACPNPTRSQIEASRSFVEQNMPIEMGSLQGEWYWKASAPCYTYTIEQQDRFRKRWDYHDRNLDWGKRKAKWSGSEGAEKNYDLPLFLRNPQVITWFAVGDKDAIASRLDSCKGIGKKRSIGNGQILRWDIQEIAEDRHLFYQGNLMRVVPYRLLFAQPEILQQSTVLLNWGWRPPVWLLENRELCVMPRNLCTNKND